MSVRYGCFNGKNKKCSKHSGQHCRIAVALAIVVVEGIYLAKVVKAVVKS